MFSICYIVEKEEKPLRIELGCTYGKVDWGLNNKIFLRLKVYRGNISRDKKKINEVECKGIMFVAYNKIRIKLLNDRNIKLRMPTYN